MLGVSTCPNTGPEEPICISIHLHEGVAEGGKELFEKIKKLSTAEMFDFNDSQLRIHIRPKELDAIAAIDQVRTIEECPSITFHDTKAVDIIYGDQPSPFVPKYQDAGQIIAVADAGFDKGSSELRYVHPAFQNRLIDVSDKKPVVHPLAEPSGHGTHVAGYAVGISSEEKAGKANENFTNTISSPAPKAELYFQVVDPEGGKFPLLPHLFTSFPDAKVHNNSWGISVKDSVRQSYNPVSGPIDKVLRQNPELLIVVAAGNVGSTWIKANAASERNIYRQIGAEGAAKNSITVGATFNRRVMEKDHGFPHHATCLDDDQKNRSSGVLGIFTEVAPFGNK